MERDQQQPAALVAQDRLAAPRADHRDPSTSPRLERRRLRRARRRPYPVTVTR